MSSSERDAGTTTSKLGQFPYLRSLLDRALGQRRNGAEHYLSEIPRCIEVYGAPPDFLKIVAIEYPQLVKPLEHVLRFDFYGDPRKPVQKNSNLKKEHAKLVFDHLPLVRKLAWERASQINNLAGGTCLDEDLFAELENIGVTVLWEQVQEWDSNRGVTFGAYVQKRVAGAMENYMTRDRERAVSLPLGGEANITSYGMTESSQTAATAREAWKWEIHGRRAKGNRTSTGARKTQSYIETPTQGPDRLISAKPNDMLAEALARLKPRQRAVYEGRMLADPQASLSDLAAQLGVSRPRIVQLEKDAIRHVSKYLLSAVIR